MSPNDADRMANSVDPDQTAPVGAVWSRSALFAQTYLSENVGSLRYIFKFYGSGIYYCDFYLVYTLIVNQLEMIWICGLNSNKDTKSLNLFGREIPIIVFGLHVHNLKKQPSLTLF